MLSHEHSCTALLGGALLSQSGDLSVVVDTVELEYGEFHSLVLVLDHLGSGVHFLLSLLSTSSKSENKMKGSLLRDVVVAERTSVLELRLWVRFVSIDKKGTLDLRENDKKSTYLLSSKDKTLLIRRNSFLILNLLLHTLDRVAGLDVERDGLSGKCFHENLHFIVCWSFKK